MPTLPLFYPTYWDHMPFYIEIFIQLILWGCLKDSVLGIPGNCRKHKHSTHITCLKAIGNMSMLDQQRHNYLMVSLKFGYGQEQSTNLVSNIRLVLILDNHNHKLTSACVEAYSQSNMFFIVTIVCSLISIELSYQSISINWVKR